MRLLQKMTVNPNSNPAVNALAPLTEALLNSIHGYGMSTEQSFGWWANRYSVAMALSCNTINVETIAEAIHDGWSKCVFDVEDPIYNEKPQKKESRLTLANTAYAELSENEKNKDRQIAYIVAAFLHGRLG
jgi:hypothetical protein